MQHCNDKKTLTDESQEKLSRAADSIQNQALKECLQLLDDTWMNAPILQVAARLAPNLPLWHLATQILTHDPSAISPNKLAYYDIKMDIKWMVVTKQLIDADDAILTDAHSIRIIPTRLPECLTYVDEYPQCIGVRSQTKHVMEIQQIRQMLLRCSQATCPWLQNMF